LPTCSAPNGDFSFPYRIRGSEVAKARKHSKDLFLNDKWPKAKHKLQRLIDKFNPPGWGRDKGVVYYTTNRLNMKLARACRKQIAKAKLPVVSVSLKPLGDFGENIHLPLKPGPLTMFKQILAGLEASTAEVIFFCEHDVLYHPSHFDFVPPEKDKFYYNTNVWKVRPQDGHAMRTDDCRQTSGLCAYRDLLLEHYRKRVEMVEKDGFSRSMGFEPGTHGRAERVDDHKSDRWESEYPNIDIRHEGTMTPTKWKKEKFRNKRFTKGWTESTVDGISGWDNLEGIVKDAASRKL